MTGLPRALEDLVAELGKLPGIGRRSAERMAFALLDGHRVRPDDLIAVLSGLRDQVGLCADCGAFTDHNVCPFCSSTSREDTVICIVETPHDVIAFERAGGFRGRYHVLGGVLSPLKGVTSDNLLIAPLEKRLDGGLVREVILATSPTVEGDATALYLAHRLEREGVSFTRIGRGVPMGSSLELTDASTLRLSMEGRRSI